MGLVVSLESQRTFRREKLMKKPTVFDVARYFLSCVDHGAGSLMTHLKLQKLCYYAQVRIPLKSTTESGPTRPPVPAQNDQ